MEITAEELIRLYTAGERNFAGIDLHRTPGGDGIFRNLKGANLKEAKLGGADLTRACLESANLTKACLRGANLFQSNLSSAILIESDLSGASELRSINMDGTFLWKTILPGGTIEVAPR